MKRITIVSALSVVLFSETTVAQLLGGRPLGDPNYVDDSIRCQTQFPRGSLDDLDACMRQLAIRRAQLRQQQANREEQLRREEERRQWQESQESQQQATQSRQQEILNTMRETNATVRRQISEQRRMIGLQTVIVEKCAKWTNAQWWTADSMCVAMIDPASGLRVVSLQQYGAFLDIGWVNATQKQIEREHFPLQASHFQ